MKTTSLFCVELLGVLLLVTSGGLLYGQVSQPAPATPQPLQTQPAAVPVAVLNPSSNPASPTQPTAASVAAAPASVPPSQPAPALTTSSNAAPAAQPSLTPASPPVTAPPAPPVSSPVALPVSAPVDPNEIRITGMGKGSTSWTIVVLLTFLTLIPSLLLCMTPFARLLVVFHFLRQALGLQTTPTNQTLIGLALILTFFLMQPVGETIYQSSVLPLQEGHISAMQAIERGEVPVRKFMSHYVLEKDVALFVELSKEPRPRNPDDLSLRVIAPAYILSELRMGFQIGTVLFLPFLVIDMVVASISTPLKLLLFVMVDGWNLLIGSLMRSFH
jgi:flagellar biosynthetic protein FliP